jgi:hypothetical protein
MQGSKHAQHHLYVATVAPTGKGKDCTHGDKTRMQGGRVHSVGESNGWEISSTSLPPSDKCCKMYGKIA